jgi:hypothetical protein
MLVFVIVKKNLSDAKKGAQTLKEIQEKNERELGACGRS